MDNNVTSLVTTVSGAIETSRCNWKIPQDKSGANNIQVISNTYSPTRDLGLDAGDDTVAAAYNATPSQTLYWHVFRIPGGATDTVTAYVQIEYRVELFNRNEINQSQVFEIKEKNRKRNLCYKIFDIKENEMLES